MAIPTTCPSCGNAGQVPDSYAGRKVECPKCLRRFSIPAGEPEEEEIPLLDLAPEQEPKGSYGDRIARLVDEFLPPGVGHDQGARCYRDVSGIPAKILHGAISSYARKVHKDEVLAVMDSTLLGSG